MIIFYDFLQQKLFSIIIGEKYRFLEKTYQIK